MSEYELIQKLVVEMQSSETPVLPVYKANLFSIAKAAYKQARTEVIEEVRNSILEIIKERTNAGLDDMEGADYKEFLQAESFVVAMGIVKDEVIKALTKLSEVEK